MSCRLSILVPCAIALCLACASPLDPVETDGERSAPAGVFEKAIETARDAVVDSLGVEPNDLALRDLRSDGRDGARVRFEMFRDGLPVDGGDAIVVLRGAGRPPIVIGSFDLPPNRLPATRLDAAAATQAALAELAARASDVALVAEPSPRLVALPLAGALVPVWRVVVSGESQGRALRREVYVDALGGQVAHEREGLRATQARGSGIGVTGKRRALDIYHPPGGGYQLRDDTRVARGIRTSSAGGGWRLPGRMVVSPDPHAWDEEGPAAGAAVDAHANAAATIDWLASVLGRDSWDDEGAPVRLVVHFGQRLDNAFWDGRRAVFGDGDGLSSRPFAAALDIVAHEIFHGVIDSEANLVYEDQPGAISESLADVFGNLVEAGTSWGIGEAAIDPPLRDLGDPAALGLPDHMSDYLPLPPTPDDDMGGVHFNSTIPSHAAALVADGGRHRRSGLTVPRIGRAAMRDIWWRALTLYLAPRARFIDLARATQLAAEDLHGAQSMQATAVEAVWQAVGVLP